MSIFIALSSAVMHHSHFKLGMVLPLQVLHLAYWIHVHQLTASCSRTVYFQTYLVNVQIFVALFSATMHPSHFKLGIVPWLGAWHVANQIHVASFLLPVLRLSLFQISHGQVSNFCCTLRGYTEWIVTDFIAFSVISFLMHVRKVAGSKKFRVLTRPPAILHSSYS